MIKMEGISKHYNLGEETVKALDDVSLHIAQGEFVAIIGPSGSGKSTLMNIIGCLDIADKGSYALDGLSIGNYSENELAEIRNNKIGFIFQGFNLLGKLTAEENVELPLIYQKLGGAERRKHALDALEKVGLANRRKHKPSELSGGQQQRVAIARALASRPSIILADEPTGNLDSKTGADILKLFGELNEAGNTIVLITHDPKVASRAKRCVEILDGHINGEAGTC
jgi:putative ABC transport system ATP-binding protein